MWNTAILKESPIEKDVVIIGGGCAGMECAEKLYTYGIENIVVLEAQDYIGGRCKTDFIDDDETKPLEMGANWIHGLWGNPLYRLVQENGQVFHHKKEKLFCDSIVQFVDEHGRIFDPMLCLAFYDLYLQWNIEAKSIWYLPLFISYYIFNILLFKFNFI